MKEDTLCRIPMFKEDYNKLFWKEKNKPAIIWFQNNIRVNDKVFSLIHLGFEQLYEENPWELAVLYDEPDKDVWVVDRFSDIIDAVEALKELMENEVKEKC